ncbi:hypothetical protein CIK75_10165 [Glutamicibacter sp. BW78]|nr:hypothetical protein CIK75_10165 [Glutamicibacter sp. BW78]
MPFHQGGATKQMFNELHVGRGSALGPLTIFPLWTEATAVADYALADSLGSQYRVVDMPTTHIMIVQNICGKPLLLLEGQLMAETTPSRIVRQSVLIGAQQSASIEVAYAGMERWGFDGLPIGRHFSARIFAAEWLEGGARGSSVYEGFARHISFIGPAVDSVRVFPGQVGVVIGIDGHPAMAEVFDRPEALTHRLHAILAAVLYDVLTFGPPSGQSTPSVRSRRFLSSAAEVPMRKQAAIGMEETISGRSRLLSIEGIRWRGTGIHAVATNNRHARNQLL